MHGEINKHLDSLVLVTMLTRVTLLRGGEVSAL